MQHVALVVGQGRLDGVGLNAAQVELRHAGEGGHGAVAAASGQRLMPGMQGGGQVFGKDTAALGHIDGKIHAVHKLAHVAGPGVVFHNAQCLGRKAAKRLAVGAAQSAAVVFRNEADVVLALA